MDKTVHSSNKTVTHKKGFALLITLSVLTVVIALTTVLLSYFTHVKEDAEDTKAMIQANLYYADIAKIFNDFKEKKTLFNTLYLMPVPLNDEDGRLSVTLKCDPLARGVNINWLAGTTEGASSQLQTTAQALLEFIAQTHGLQDASMLEEMLLEQIGTSDNKFVTFEQSRLRQKNGIISYKQFSDILTRYQIEADDPKASQIPWQEYFSFSATAEKIDVEHSAPELISWLFGIDLASVKEWHKDPEKGSVKNFVINNGGDYEGQEGLLVESEFLAHSTCSVVYALAESAYRFSFDYIQGEAKHFEFHGKQ